VLEPFVLGEIMTDRIGTMQRHAEQLCFEHQIVWNRNLKRRAYALREIEEIHTPPIRSPISYATVLHEIGHILGRHQTSRRVMVRETWAWNWARPNAIVWTPAMERSATKALAWYAPRAAAIDAKENAAGPTGWEAVDVADQAEATQVLGRPGS
jgi:hypothetical protein